MANNHSELEKRLWDAADDLRANSKLKSAEYSVPVLGLIFLRYADHKFALAEKKLAQQGSPPIDIHFCYPTPTPEKWRNEQIYQNGKYLLFEHLREIFFDAHRASGAAFSRANREAGSLPACACAKGFV